MMRGLFKRQEHPPYPLQRGISPAPWKPRFRGFGGQSPKSRIMKMIKHESVVLVMILYILTTVASHGQELIISSGTRLTTNGGIVTLKGDLENNGTCLNSDCNFVFNGSTQEIRGNFPVAFDNLTINFGSAVTMSTPGQSMGGILLSDGILNADGNLTLLSSELRTALIDGSGEGEVYGNVTMQRYLVSGFGYKYFSSPFQGAYVSEFSDNMKLDDPFPAFYSYDESRTTSGWVTYIDPGGLLNPLEGYAVNFGSSSSPLTFDVSGVVNNGNQSVTLYNHNNTYSQGFNLVGNPYPSPIDWDATSGWTRSNIDDAVYYFQASTTDEYAGNYVTYINGVSSNDSATNVIPSMQGFFVHVSDGEFPVTGTMTLNNNVRITDMTHPLIKSGGESRPLIRLTAEYEDDTLSADPAVIYFDEKATENFDGQLDALKLMNTDWFVTNFYSIGSDGRKMSINAFPLITDTLYRVPLGLKINMPGNILFKVKTLEGDLNDMEIYFTDTIAKVRQLVDRMNGYEANLAAGQYDNRFFLEFRNLSTGIPDNTAQPEDLFNIYSTGGILKLEINELYGREGTLTLINFTGQILLTCKYYDRGIYELSPGFKSGIYIASFSTGSKRSSKKIYIRSR